MVFYLYFLFAVLSAAAPADPLPKFDNEIVRASDLLRAGEAQKALALFDQLLRSARADGNELHAARASVGIAACAVTMHDYKLAVQNGEQALRFGLRVKNADIAVQAALNLSSVYRRLGDNSAAVQMLRELNPLLPQITDPKVKAPLYVQAAILTARAGSMSQAEPLFFAAVDSALNSGDLQMAAACWSQLGLMRLQRNDPKGAEGPLIESFRLRRAAGNRNIAPSYTYLGMLRLEQGDAVSALNLLDRAVEISRRTNVTIPVYVIYYWRAKVKEQLKDIPGALADYDRAIQWISQWRQEVLPTDGFRISAEVGLDKAYDEYVRTGMQAARATGDSALERRMFEISEQHKSASFRESLRTGRQLPAEYWEALNRYRAVLTASLDAPSEASESERVRLARIESSLGLAVAGESSASLVEIQKQLNDKEALISFHTGAEQSYVWAITKSGFESHFIPGTTQIATVARKFRTAVERDSSLDGTNAKLHDMLFGSLSAGIRSQPNWILSLDQELYDVPFAALGPEQTPLVLVHSLRTLPGASLLTRPVGAWTDGGFVGAGDAIYNGADPRWKGPRREHALAFARLVNTRGEVLRVAKAWRSETKPTFLFGESFNRDSLDRALRAAPAVVHLAAHVVQGQTNSSSVMIGIGLGKDGNPDFLTAADIASNPARLGLVTINGCASGAGAALPGAGLIGLTRSWLLSGATAVAATHWPVTDDRGDLFSHMYNELTRSGVEAITAAAAAQALQSAQVAALRSGGRRAKPYYWAAVFIAGKR